MGKVRTGLAVSLDGFISGPNDGAEVPMGVGGERLLAWYGAGDTEYRLPGTGMVFKVSAQTAHFLRETRHRLAKGRTHAVLTAHRPRVQSRPATRKYQVKDLIAGNGRQAFHHPVPAPTPGS